MMQDSNGLGLKAASGKDYCEVTIQFPGDTVPKWVCSPQCSSTFLSFLCLLPSSA